MSDTWKSPTVLGRNRERTNLPVIACRPDRGAKGSEPPKRKTSCGLAARRSRRVHCALRAGVGLLGAGGLLL